MLTISRPLTPAQADEYYEKEYVAGAAQSLIRGDGVLPGWWSGRLADEWGLTGGDVTREQFVRLCDGRHPVTDERLVSHARPKTCANFYGEEVTSVARRAGYDATFSAPKTVSLAALVGGDRRVTLAHREAVREALDVLEENACARMGGNTPSQNTGRLAVACFEHEFARPDRVSGYAAPQLHTHCVVFNVTLTDDGRTKALQPLELHRAQRLATALYRSALAWQLAGLGYEVARDPRTGAPEIEGFTREYIEASSPRRAEIVGRAEKMAARIEDETAGVVRRGAGLLHAAAHADRGRKDFDPDRMRERHLEMDARFGHQARTAVERSLARGLALRDETEATRLAREAVAASREAALLRGARVDARCLLAEALMNGMAETTHTAVRAEFDLRLAAGDLREVLRERRAEGVEAGAARDITPTATSRQAGRIVFDGGGPRADPVVPGEHARPKEVEVGLARNQSGASSDDVECEAKPASKARASDNVDREVTAAGGRDDVQAKGVGRVKDNGMEISF